MASRMAGVGCVTVSLRKSIIGGIGTLSEIQGLWACNARHTQRKTTGTARHSQGNTGIRSYYFHSKSKAIVTSSPATLRTRSRLGATAHSKLPSHLAA